MKILRPKDQRMFVILFTGLLLACLVAIFYLPSGPSFTPNSYKKFVDADLKIVNGQEMNKIFGNNEGKHPGYYVLGKVSYREISPTITLELRIHVSNPNKRIDSSFVETFYAMKRGQGYFFLKYIGENKSHSTLSFKIKSISADKRRL